MRSRGPVSFLEDGREGREVREEEREEEREEDGGEAADSSPADKEVREEEGEREEGGPPDGSGLSPCDSSSVNCAMFGEEEAVGIA